MVIGRLVKPLFYSFTSNLKFEEEGDCCVQSDDGTMLNPSASHQHGYRYTSYQIRLQVEEPRPCLVFFLTKQLILLKHVLFSGYLTQVNHWNRLFHM